MGGPGSTRWGRHTKRGLVETTPRIYLSELARGGAFRDHDTAGSIEWTSNTGQLLARAGFLISAPGENRSRDCKIGVSLPDKSQFLVEIDLDPVRTRFGGYWWIARCPGSDCDRRAVKLYVDIPGEQIGCRNCLGLTHRSSQTQDKRRDHARRDPEGFVRSREHLTSPASQMITSFMVLEAIDFRDRRSKGRGWGRSASRRAAS